MKKMMNAALCALFCAGMTMGIHATEVTVPGSDSGDVFGTYTPGTETETVYKVDITWGSMDFTYKGPAKGTWDPESHSYKNGEQGKWTNSESMITVTNHSNTGINVSTGYQAETGFEGAHVEMTPSAVEISSADAELDDQGIGTPQTVEIHVQVNGELPETTVESTKIGTITLTVK